MGKREQPYRLGDHILDRYMPDASEAEREEARENLRGFAALLVQIDERLIREGRERGDSPSC